MKIHAEINLADLAERMGGPATQAEVTTMRELLVAGHEGEDTANVPEAVRAAMLDDVSAS